MLQSMQQGGDALLEEEARESEELGALDAPPQDGSSSPEARPKESLLFAAARCAFMVLSLAHVVGSPACRIFRVLKLHS